MKQHKVLLGALAVSAMMNRGAVFSEDEDMNYRYSDRVSYHTPTLRGSKYTPHVGKKQMAKAAKRGRS